METGAVEKKALEAPDMIESQETLTPSPQQLLSPPPQMDAPHGESTSEPEPSTETGDQDDAAVPLNLDHRDLQWPRYDEEELASLISSILAAHRGPTRRLSIRAVHLHRRPDTVDAWLRSPALEGLEELEFDIAGLYELAPEPLLPASAFRFWDTLVAATFAKCRVPDGGVLCFPKLRQLGLEDVAISEDSLHGVIAGCPALESLLVTGRSRFSCIRINSPTLVSLGLRVYTEELVIEDAPLLEVAAA
ncbi:unnamed protein product [Urochloa humidicola]